MWLVLYMYIFREGIWGREGAKGRERKAKMKKSEGRGENKKRNGR